MPRFSFRLKTSLRLAEQKLDEIKILLAHDIALMQVQTKARDKQRSSWISALEGQRKVGLSYPDELGSWQIFAAQQLMLLRQCEQELVLQEESVEKIRLKLIEANRECEKLIRLREKQATVFQAELDRREQGVLDEVAQVQYRKGLMK